MEVKCHKCKHSINCEPWQLSDYASPIGCDDFEEGAKDSIQETLGYGHNVKYME